jgi:hypothetical protein
MITNDQKAAASNSRAGIREPVARTTSANVAERHQDHVPTSGAEGALGAAMVEHYSTTPEGFSMIACRSGASRLRLGA